MTKRVAKLYTGALKNKEFNAAMFDADRDTPPDKLSMGYYKTIYASMYYGWLICKYGVKWEENI